MSLLVLNDPLSHTRRAPSEKTMGSESPQCQSLLIRTGMPNPGTAIFTKHAGRGRQRDIRTLGRETAVHAESVCISGRLSDNNTRWNPMSTVKAAAHPRQQTTLIKDKSSVIHTFKSEDAITGDLICVHFFCHLVLLLCCP